MNTLKLDINKYLSNDKSRINPIFAAINEGTLFEVYFSWRKLILVPGNFGIAKKLLSSGTIKTALTDADNNIVLIRLAKIIPKEQQVDVYSALIDTLLYQMKTQGMIMARHTTIFLTESGVDVNHQNNAGETALHAAAFRANNLGIQYLINEGGDMMKQTLYVPLMNCETSSLIIVVATVTRHSTTVLWVTHLRPFDCCSSTRQVKF